MTAIQSPPARSGGSATTDPPPALPTKQVDAGQSGSSFNANAQQAYVRSASARLVQVAQTLQQVESAWRLVHDTYATLGLINPNEHQIHTVPEAVHPMSAVLTHEVNQQTRATMTIMPDGRAGLPLDCIYPAEIAKLRSTGRRLVEIGLLADTSTRQSNSASVIIEMMRHAFWFAWLHKADIVIGVHPKHAGFYRRYFGFETMGEESTHPTVNHWPVVPLYIPVDHTLQQTTWPRGVAALVRAPMPMQAFNQRCKLTNELIADSPIGRYLQDKAAALEILAA